MCEFCRMITFSQGRRPSGSQFIDADVADANRANCGAVTYCGLKMPTAESSSSELKDSPKDLIGMKHSSKRPLHVYQIGFPKSGNYWTWKIIDQILLRSDHPRSTFIESQPIHKISKDYPVSFPEQPNIDFVGIDESGLYSQMYPYFRKRIFEEEEPLFYDRSTHAWANTPYCAKTSAVLSQFDKKVFIVRDPRDVAVSSATFRHTDFMKQYLGPVKKPLEVSVSNSLKTMPEQWLRFVGPYLMRLEELGFHVLFYERLRANFQDELQKLLSYLEVSLQSSDCEELQEAVSFEVMKKESNGHLGKGMSGYWRNLPDSVLEEINRPVASVLSQLGYPMTSSAHVGNLPSLPKDMSSFSNLLSDLLAPKPGRIAA